MMQQVASVKSESAASALPLTIAGTDESKQAFNQVLSQESGRMTAFESARQRADSAASNSAANNSAANNTAANNTAANNSSVNNRNNHQKDRATKVDTAEESTRTKGPNDTDTDSVSDKSATSNLDSVENKQVVNEKTNDEKALHSVDGDKDAKPGVFAEEQVTEETESEFDFISYVTKVAEFSGTQATASDPDITVNTGNTEGTEVSKDISLQIPIFAEHSQNADVNEFLNISLSKDELQTILDAQNAQLDLSQELSAAELNKLQDIIASMLNQLDQQKNDNTLSDLEKVKSADQALLASLLMSKPQATQNTTLIDQNMPKAEASALDTLKAQVTNSASTSDLAKVKPILKDVSSKQDVQSAVLANEVSDLTKPQDPEVELKARMSIPEAGIKISDKDVWSKTPDTNVKLPQDFVKTAIKNVAGLEDRQSTEALTNLTERVQSIVNELKTPVKGNEFVAALQAGVKEFKQQMASGREPGIDLKDIVNEAIASTNVEVSSEKQLKIDTTINQFNAVLNLANAVNYSATQQQAQVLGVTDNQFAKEINVLQSEGTKLANAANSQLNAQVNGDKAINIFKSEGQQQLAEKVRWMVNSRNPSAEIRLDPPDLGGMQIKVNLSGDTAQVNFSVQSVAAKEALDQAVPRLRDMLAQQGIELGQSDVQQQNQQQQNDHRDGEASNGQSASAAISGLGESTDDANAPVIEQRISNGTIGGVDFYA